MRVFAAVVPPPEATEHLADHLAPRVEAGQGLRWTDTHQWHVTLAFMPSVHPDVVEALVERVADAAGRVPAAAVRVCGVGCFPDVATARVLWAGVEDEREMLPRLARRVRSAGNVAGADPEGGRFRPHLTLARFGRPTEATRWVRALSTYAGPSWVADEVQIVESHLGEGRGRRPRYEVLARVPLTG